MLKVDFLDSLKISYPDNFDNYDYGELPSEFRMGDVLNIRCLTHGLFNQSGKLHNRGYGCPVCGQLKRAASKTLSQTEFINRAKLKHGEKYDYSETKYLHGKEKIAIRCRIHGSFEQFARDHLNGHGCRECHLNDRRSDTDTFIQRAYEIHGDRYDYSETVYYNKRTKVKIKCPKHGIFEQLAHGHLSGCGCPACSESKGELEIASLLSEWGINFIREYKIGDSLYRYDFFLPDQNILIEFHGLQHYRPITYFGGEENFKGVCDRDLKKRKKADDLNIPLLVLNFKHLENGTLRQVLVESLRKCYKHWFRINGKIIVFRHTPDASIFLGLPKTFVFKHLESKVSKDIQVLF